MIFMWKCSSFSFHLLDHDVSPIKNVSEWSIKNVCYLRSAERFDPREHSWTRIEGMNAKRGCHSVTVMNEKL